MKNKRGRFLFCLLLLTTHIYADEAEENEVLWVTIFLHGAITIRPYLTIPNLLVMLRDKLDGSIYKLSVELIRDDPYIFQTQAMQGRGLLEVDVDDDRSSACATLFSHLYDRVLKEVYPEKKMTRYYTYGWSGLFSHNVRIEEAKDFYTQVKLLRNTLEQQFPSKHIHITAIGYSHGGNIILGSGNAYSKDPEKDFFFDEVILIGTPIQNETKSYAGNAALFKKIYVFYSRSDRAVVLDFFSFKRFFSSRYFHQHGTKPLPENIFQIELRMADQVLATRYKPRRVKREFYKTVDYSPGHTELWSFGWVESGFRKHFPFYPLPIATFLPYFKKVIDDHTMPHMRHFIEHIHLHKKFMAICPRFSYIKSQVPFVSTELIEELQTFIEEKRPKNFHRREYDERFTTAIDKIKAERVCEKKENAKRNLCRRRRVNEQPIKCLL